MTTLTLLDIVVILCVGGAALLGLMRGFVFEVLSLFAWAAVVVALKILYAPIALMLGGVLSTKAGAGLAAFVLIGAVVFWGGRVLANRIGRRTRTSVLGPVDRVLGLGFGAVKGLIGATLIFMAFNLLYDIGYGGRAARPDWVRTARTYPLLQASRRAIDDLVARRRAGSPGQGGAAGDASTNAVATPI